jgi:hypothetical protein
MQPLSMRCRRDIPLNVQRRRSACIE